MQIPEYKQDSTPRTDLLTDAETRELMEDPRSRHSLKTYLLTDDEAQELCERLWILGIPSGTGRQREGDSNV